MRFTSSLLLGGASLAQGLSCNGRAELCDRKYSNITMVGTHDSPFVGFLPADNQHESVEEQLGQGVRYLQAQTHDKNGVIQMCHTSCVLRDADTLQQYLVTVRDFLESNPYEVVTILLTNPDNIDVAEFGGTFKEAGLDALAFAPAADLKLDDWPTLGAMVAEKKRLVVFMGELCCLPPREGGVARGQPLLRTQQLIYCRLPCRPEQGALHSGRVQLLCRDAVRHDGQRLPPV